MSDNPNEKKERSIEEIMDEYHINEEKINVEALKSAFPSSSGPGLTKLEFITTLVYANQGVERKDASYAVVEARRIIARINGIK